MSEHPNSRKGSEPLRAEATSSVQAAIEISVQVGAIALLVGLCLWIVAPFAGTSPPNS